MLESSPEVIYWLTVIIFILLAGALFFSARCGYLVIQRKRYIASHEVHLVSYERIITLAAKHDILIDQMAAKFNEYEQRTCKDLATLKMRLSGMELDSLVNDLETFKDLPPPGEHESDNNQNDTRLLPSPVSSFEDWPLIIEQNHQQVKNTVFSSGGILGDGGGKV